MAALNICREAKDVFDVTKNEVVCPKERNILAEVFENLNLNEKDWVKDDAILQNEDHCDWNYINCKNGNVQSIILTGMALSGSISASIGTLTHLEVLNLLDNQIVNTIPPEIGQLSHLRELILAQNRIQKEVPKELKNLGN